MQNICKTYATNMHKYASNMYFICLHMHKYACICIKYEINMQNICNNIQEICKKYARNMHKYVKICIVYAEKCTNMQEICI